jgi:hypothetical protein
MKNHASQKEAVAKGLRYLMALSELGIPFLYHYSRKTGSAKY